MDQVIGRVKAFQRSGGRGGGGGAGPSSPISERMGSKTLVWVTVRKRSVLNLPPSAVLLLELVAG